MRRILGLVSLFSILVFPNLVSANAFGGQGYFNCTLDHYTYCKQGEYVYMMTDDTYGGITATVNNTANNPRNCAAVSILITVDDVPVTTTQVLQPGQKTDTINLGNYPPGQHVVKFFEASVQKVSCPDDHDYSNEYYMYVSVGIVKTGSIKPTPPPTPTPEPGGITTFLDVTPDKLPPDSKDPFVVKVVVRNSGNQALTNVKLNGPLQVTGQGKVVKKDGPDPTAISKLGIGETKSFTFKYTPKEGGKLHFVSPGVSAKPKTGAAVADSASVKESKEVEVVVQKIVKVKVDPESVPTDSSLAAHSLAKVTVKDQLDRPIENETLHVSEPFWFGEYINTFSIMCDDQGRRAYPPRHSTLYAFDRFSDKNGEIQFTVWPGTEARAAGKIFVGAEITDADELHEHDAQFLGVNGSMGSTSVLFNLATFITAEAKVSGPNVESGKANLLKGVSATGTVAQVQTGLVIWLNELRAQNSPTLATVDFAPIHTADGVHAGVIFYPKNNPRPLRDYLVDGKALDGAYQTQVLRIEKNLTGSFSAEFEDTFMSLPDWEAGKNPQPQGLFNNPTPVPTARGRAVFGSLAPPDGENLLYLGYPYPPPASNPMAYAQFSRCLLGRLGIMSVTQYSPVNLLLTNESGQRLGIDKDGIFYAEIPSGVVAGDEPRTYVVPVGNYSVNVTGTGKGNATLIFLSPGSGEDPSLRVFEMKASPGVTEALSFSQGGEANTTSKSNIKGRSFLRISIKGIPKSIKKKRVAHLKIQSQLKTPIFGASVSVINGKSTTRALSNEAGSADVTIDAGTKRKGTIRVEVTAPGYEKVVKKVPVGY